MLAGHTAPDLAGTDEDWEVLAHGGTSTDRTDASETPRNPTGTSVDVLNGSDHTEATSSVAVAERRTPVGADTSKSR